MKYILFHDDSQTADLIREELIRRGLKFITYPCDGFALQFEGSHFLMETYGDAMSILPRES